MRVTLGVLALAAVAAGLKNVRVKVEQTCTSESLWTITAPNSIDPEPPLLKVGVAAADALISKEPLTYEAHGSLGLWNHPLGVFKFNASGAAAGEQTVYVMDGVLGQGRFAFPAAGASFQNFSLEIDVWTVLPAEDLVSTGYTFDVTLKQGNTDALCFKVSMWQPSSPADPKQDTCETATTPGIPSYPPPADLNIDTVTVDLDMAPEDRWTHIVRPRAAGISRLVNNFRNAISPKLNSTIVNLIMEYAGSHYLKRMPADYAAEIRGIAKATGVDIGYIWLENIAYELMGLCTSLVAQDPDGNMYHGRNLDFGIFMGSNATTHNWQLTQDLRDVLINVQFTRGGKVLYNSTTYAGFVGFLSGSKGPDGFSLTVNTRFDSNIDKGLIEWLLGGNDDCQFLTFATRMAIEGDADYASALKRLTNYKPMGPGYIILGGSKPAEGAVITLAYGKSTPVDVWSLKEALGNNSYYILQTNYDRTGPPAPFDDRRYPGDDCLNKIGQKGLNYESLYTMLSSNPTRNALTTFTTLMSPTTGHFEAYKAFCAPGPHCVPF
eukprot:Hpha_TRINITY_DN15393_c2_g2::TRINITY_DN15393_c2_g2_i1::g.87360::m.87360/K12348/ASAH1; acid ceramidase